MTTDIDPQNSCPAKCKPWAITIASLITIIAIISMPFIAGKPDETKMPDMINFLGRFHPVILHLPIGIFVLILSAELLAIVTRKKTDLGIFPIFFGAASAVLAVILGFLLYQGGDYETSKLLEDHLWGGISFSVIAILAFVAKAWVNTLYIPQAVYQLTVVTSVFVMSYASHDGASLTHGEDYLTKYAPDSIRKIIGLPPKQPEKTEKPLEQQIVFVDIVQPIIESRCVQCHKEGNTKGKFRMDTYEALVKGGKEGDGLKPGNADDSNIVIRAELPADDEEHMPPEGKPQLKEHELAIIKWWINEGADPKKTVAESKLTDDILAAIKKIDPKLKESEATSTESKHSDGPSDELRTSVAKIGESFPGGLTFESQASSNLTFTAVSLRKALTDQEFAKLTPLLDKMVAIDLSSTSVTDASVSLISSAKNLRVLRLPDTQITDASLDTIAGIASLESLNLYGTKVTDAGAKKLASLTNLQSLYLWQTSVTPEAIAELKKANPKLKVITGIL